MNGSTNGSHLEGAAAAPGVARAVDSGKPDPTLADPAVSERYRVIETLARRPQDALYLARRLDTGSLLELRVLSPELGAVFRRSDYNPGHSYYLPAPPTYPDRLCENIHL